VASWKIISFNSIFIIMVHSAVFALLSIALVFSSVNGQGVSPWLEVGRSVASSFIDLLGDVPIQIPNIPMSAPAAPAVSPSNTVAPTPKLVTINGKNYITFDYAVASPSPSASPAPAQTRPIIPINPLDIYKFLESAAGYGYIATIPPTTTSRPSFPSHPGPCNNGCGCVAPPPCQGPSCKPEQVRIVVVDDCNDKKSSESCSDESKSDEVDVVVPRTGSKTIHYRVRNRA
jgi:hypothetical protein